MMNVAVDLETTFSNDFNIYVFYFFVYANSVFVCPHGSVFYIVDFDYMVFSVCNIGELVCRLMFLSC